MPPHYSPYPQSSLPLTYIYTIKHQNQRNFLKNDTPQLHINNKNVIYNNHYNNNKNKNNNMFSVPCLFARVLHESPFPLSLQFPFQLDSWGKTLQLTRLLRCRFRLPNFELGYLWNNTSYNILVWPIRFILQMRIQQASSYQNPFKNVRFEVFFPYFKMT